ncbi:hypothetical protein HPCPY6261_0263 [Helicobacter pylori CPY6261]|nr:hypothetical protein HPCPY6261_0263 [Helicobacter pylori CPY6261]
MGFSFNSFSFFHKLAFHQKHYLKPRKRNFKWFKRAFAAFTLPTFTLPTFSFMPCPSFTPYLNIGRYKIL